MVLKKGKIVRNLVCGRKCLRRLLTSLEEMTIVIIASVLGVVLALLFFFANKTALHFALYEKLRHHEKTSECLQPEWTLCPEGIQSTFFKNMYARN